MVSRSSRKGETLTFFQVKESYRVVHGRDLIVHAPAPVYKYVHHKNEVIIKTDENNHFFRDIHVWKTS